MPLFLPPPPQPLIVIGSDPVAISGSAAAGVVLATNAVYLAAFELLVATTFSGGKWRTGAAATGTSDLGIYTFAGTLQANIGGVANVASTSMSQAFSGGNITLPPGQYFAAFCVSNNTDVIWSVGAGNGAAYTRCRQATNTATVGVLPSTTGGYSDTPAKFPAFALTVVGGLT